jgi:hypothetical protein
MLPTKKLTNAVRSKTTLDGKNFPKFMLQPFK